MEPASSPGRAQPITAVPGGEQGAHGLGVGDGGDGEAHVITVGDVSARTHKACLPAYILKQHKSPGEEPGVTVGYDHLPVRDLPPTSSFPFSS